MRLVPCFIFLGLTLLNGQQAPPPTTEKSQKATLEGIVVNSVTRAPLRRAEVTLQSMGGGRGGGFGAGTAAGVPGQGRGGAGGRGGVGPAQVGIQGRQAGPRMATTDAEGKYVFADVEPGRYTITAQRNGYLSGRYGASRPDSGATPLDVSAGRTLRDLRVELTPQGVIAGRVVDEEGEPLQSQMVRAIASASRSAGRGGRRGGAAAIIAGPGGQTNDRGEFRIANLPPGSYTLQVTPSRLPGIMDNQGETAYVPLFYPGVVDVSQAARIDVTPGAELTGFEVRLQKARVYKIRGRVFDPSGQPARQYSLSLMPATGAPGAMGGQQMNRTADGGFELRQVVPGSYTLLVRAMGAGGPGGPGGRGSTMVHAEPVSVGSSDLDNLVIRMAPPVVLQGLVTSRTESLNVAGARVMLIAASDAPVGVFGQSAAAAKEDGTFQLQNISAGRYQVEVMAPGGNAYVESIRYGELDILGQDFSVLPGGGGQIQVVIAADGGAVTGTVTSGGEPAAGARVVLLPADKNRWSQMFIKNATADQNGAFTARNLAPGEYLAFAGQDLPANFWENDQVFEKLERGGTRISVQRNGQHTAALQAIGGGN